MVQKLAWAAVACVAALALGVVGLHRGEPINALWLVVAALCSYAVGYRFYARFVALRVLALDDSRPTPALRFSDGLDYVPTHKGVLFGHHFAAIAGAGPLVGPVLAAQMGYAPGTLWIIVGAVLGGCVQDFVVMFLSVRRNGKTLGDMIKSELGGVVGAVAQIGILAIMIILLAVLSLVVVKALAQSPWGTFTVAATIPIAVLMGVYMRFLRPGRIAEVSLIGFALLMAALWGGALVAAEPSWAAMFTLTGVQLTWAVIVYGFAASVMPVWLLLAPRDYLSTFLKIGTIAALALGILFVLPPLQMPPVTKFIDGSGPVFSGHLFPFLFITIACGAVSGFHALISSGTTPKMLERESHMPAIGYGAMLAESFVAVMAMIAATVVQPGVYFAMNSPAAMIGGDLVGAAQTISGWGFAVTADDLTRIARDVGESTILSRTGGAPTLAVGLAHILSSMIGGQALMAFWYHFAILFEALFILTTLDAGTRVGRFMVQDLLGGLAPVLARTENWAANLLATSLCVAGWGYFLYQGVIDPLGGINTLWPLFGIANQMLAGIALALATAALVKMKREKFVWVTALPQAWLLICTLTAGWQKIFAADPRVGFLAHAAKFQAALDSGTVLPPAKSLAEMTRVIFNDRLDAALCGLFMTVLVIVTLGALAAVWRALSVPHATAREATA